MNAAHQKSLFLSFRLQDIAKTPERKSNEENPVILKYIKNHVRDLFHIPMAILIKSAAILTEDLFIEAIPAAWELLLESNQVGWRW